MDPSGHQQTPEERKEAEKQPVEAEAQENYHRSVDGWMLRWTAISAIATTLLMFIGIGGVCAALKTLGAIQRQIKVQEESLRPRLAIGFTQLPFSKAPYAEILAGRRVVFAIELINTGGIPAYEVVPETWVEWLERPFEFTSAARYHKGEPLTVHPREPTHYKVPFTRGLTQAEILAYRNGDATICIRIRLTYKAFGAVTHTQEAFTTEVAAMGTIGKYSEAN